MQFCCRILDLPVQNQRGQVGGCFQVSLAGRAQAQACGLVSATDQMSHLIWTWGSCHREAGGGRSPGVSSPGSSCVLPWGQEELQPGCQEQASQDGCRQPSLQPRLPFCSVPAFLPSCVLQLPGISELLLFL